MIRDYRRFYAMCKAFDKTKEEVVHEFTDGRTTSCRELTDEEFKGLFDSMVSKQRGNFQPKPGDAQRKKLIGIARSMQWGRNTMEVIGRLDEWCIKSFGAKMNDLDLATLGKAVTIFESKVYTGYLKALRRAQGDS